jgi:hypothetical protein
MICSSFEEGAFLHDERITVTINAAVISRALTVVVSDLFMAVS